MTGTVKKQTLSLKHVAIPNLKKATSQLSQTASKNETKAANATALASVVQNHTLPVFSKKPPALSQNNTSNATQLSTSLAAKSHNTTHKASVKQTTKVNATSTPAKKTAAAK